MKLKTDRKKDLSMIFAALIVALVYIICVIYIYQSLNVSETDSGESSRRQVAVIVKSTDSAFWKSVFSGAGAAATEYNLSVTTQGPENVKTTMDEAYKRVMSGLVKEYQGFVENPDQ